MYWTSYQLFLCSLWGVTVSSTNAIKIRWKTPPVNSGANKPGNFSAIVNRPLCTSIQHSLFFTECSQSQKISPLSRERDPESHHTTFKTPWLGHKDRPNVSELPCTCASLKSTRARLSPIIESPFFLLPDCQLLSGTRRVKISFPSRDEQLSESPQDVVLVQVPRFRDRQQLPGG